MKRYRVKFRDGATVAFQAASMITAWYAAKDWHTHARYRADSHEPKSIEVIEEPTP